MSANSKSCATFLDFMSTRENGAGLKGSVTRDPSVSRLFQVQSANCLSSPAHGDEEFLSCSNWADSAAVTQTCRLI